VAKRPVDSDREYEVVQISEDKDPVIWWLQVAIAFVVVFALVAVLYGLIAGLINAPTPRTATEARLVLLEQVVRDTPGSGAAWRDYASALYVSGKKSEAKALIGRSRSAVKDIDRTYPYLIELDILWMEKDYAKVIKKAEESYKADQKYKAEFIQKKARDGRKIRMKDIPTDATIAILLYQGRANGALQKWDEAVAALSKAIELDPRASDLLVLRAEAQVKAGNEAAARKDYKAALTFIPDMPAALEGLKKLDTGK